MKNICHLSIKWCHIWNEEIDRFSKCKEVNVLRFDLKNQLTYQRWIRNHLSTFFSFYSPFFYQTQIQFSFASIRLINSHQRPCENNTLTKTHELIVSNGYEYIVKIPNNTQQSLVYLSAPFNKNIVLFRLFSNRFQIFWSTYKFLSRPLEYLVNALLHAHFSERATIYKVLRTVGLLFKFRRSGQRTKTI